MEWSADQYLKFAGERTRAARDLLLTVEAADPKRIVDLGCGPGNSTELLAARYPSAEITGLDVDADMIATARRARPDLSFLQGDIATWEPDAPVDLLFANASLQWLDHHEQLFPRLVSFLQKGGALAVQMPDNLEEPTHIAMRTIARDPRWADRLDAAADQRKPLLSPQELQALLRPLCQKLDVWKTTYHFEMAGISGVEDWFKGSALRPYLQQLSADEQADFLAAWRDEIKPFYPVSEGRCLLAFPRAFFICTR